jgi:NDP-sugar pyrophosphorylase family protein
MWATQQLAYGLHSPAGYLRMGEALVHSSAQVDASARFVGPVRIGPRSVIGSNAMVIGPTTVGTACTVEAEAVISRSAVWDRCRVGAGAVVDQCVLTVDANVESELVVRNTVCVAFQHPGQVVTEWLTSRCWLTPDRDFESETNRRLGITVASGSPRSHSREFRSPMTRAAMGNE